jgi:hypothetical protein
MRSPLTAVFLIVSATAVAVAGADDPFNGTWKLNPAKSTYSPARPVGPAATLKYDATADQLTSTTEEIDPEGKPYSNRYTARYDGRDVPIVAGLLGADTIALTRVDASTIEATLKRGGKIIGTSTRVLSRDGQVMTITTVGTNAGGVHVKNVAVFEKQ